MGFGAVEVAVGFGFGMGMSFHTVDMATRSKYFQYNNKVKSRIVLENGFVKTYAWEADTWAVSAWWCISNFDGRWWIWSPWGVCWGWSPWSVCWGWSPWSVCWSWCPGSVCWCWCRISDWRVVSTIWAFSSAVISAEIKVCDVSSPEITRKLSSLLPQNWVSWLRWAIADPFFGVNATVFVLDSREQSSACTWSSLWHKWTNWAVRDALEKEVGIWSWMKTKSVSGQGTIWKSAVSITDCRWAIDWWAISKWVVASAI
jgi:hypothetical protein